MKLIITVQYGRALSVHSSSDSKQFCTAVVYYVQSQYSIPLSKITLLITINFGLQLIIDFAVDIFLSIKSDTGYLYL